MPDRPVRRMISLTLPVLIVLTAVVAGLTPASASAASPPITAYVIKEAYSGRAPEVERDNG